MPELAWCTAEEDIQDVGMLECESGFIIEILLTHLGRDQRTHVLPRLWTDLVGGPQHPCGVCACSSL